MVLICSNSKSFRIGKHGGEPLSEIRLKGFDILCWKIVPRRPFHNGRMDIWSILQSSSEKGKGNLQLKVFTTYTVPAHLLAIDEINFN